MEATYIKQTVGPILAEALASLALHQPLSQTESSYRSTMDPITYIGQFLLQADASAKRGIVIGYEREVINAKLAAHQETLRLEKEARARFSVQLRQRLSERASAIETALEALEERQKPEPIIEAVAETIPATVSEEPAAPTEVPADQPAAAEPTPAPTEL